MCEFILPKEENKDFHGIEQWSKSINLNVTYCLNKRFANNKSYVKNLIEMLKGNDAWPFR